jgi:hypothetical protein
MSRLSLVCEDISEFKKYDGRCTEHGNRMGAPIDNPPGRQQRDQIIRAMTHSMKNNPILRLAAMVFVASAMSCLGQEAGLKDAVVLVIRHAEKLESGQDLSPAGYQHAEAYVKYFGDFQVDGKPLKLDSLFASADSQNSHRPRLTLEPLSRALHLSLDTRFKDKRPELLADELKSKPHGKAILICWHHGKIPELLRALGADPGALLPGGRWPEAEFGWVIELRYDSEGKLRPEQCLRIDEHLALKETGSQQQ